MRPRSISPPATLVAPDVGDKKPALLSALQSEHVTRAGFGAVVLSHFLCAFGFSVFSLLTKYLMTARGFSQAATGPTVMGLPLGALLFSVPLFFVASRYPKARILKAAALVFAALSGLFALAPNAAHLPLLTLLVGGACMVVFNAGAGLVAELSAERGMARALGFHGAAGMLGHALGPLAMESLASRYGWGASFLLAAFTTSLSALLPLPVIAPSEPAHAPQGFSFATGRRLLPLSVAAVFAGIMHNALWTSHQPLILARGGSEVRDYFLGMSAGALTMRVLFAGLPDRVGHGRAVRGALGVYVVATLGMTWVSPPLLLLFGLLHGLAHGVFYPALAALATLRAGFALRGQALIAIYAAFNLGATSASIGFARFGESFGPAAVFPLAAALGAVGWLALRGASPKPARELSA